MCRTLQLLTKKARAGEERDLGMILCIGEKKEEREAAETDAVCARQMAAFKEGVTNWDKIVIAYEPVWAIGTGLSATPEMAQQAHAAVLSTQPVYSYSDNQKSPML